MAYEKRLCVLKQIKKGFSADGGAVSGALHAERLGDTLTLTLRLLDIAPVREGRYALVVRVGERTLLFDLSEERTLRAEGVPSLKNGFSALLCFVRGEAEGVAFGYCGEGCPDYRVLLSALFEREKKRTAKKSAPKAVEEAGVSQETLPSDLQFHDEAIAEENYFQWEKENEGAGNENEIAVGGGQEEGTAQAVGDRAPQNEADGVVRPFLVDGAPVYYEQLREKLEALFAKYPRDTRLLGAFPQSEWANADGTLFGVIYEKGAPRYLCVAKTEQGEGFEQSRFVPLAPYSKEGLFVLFQSAQTGEIITVSDL